MAEYYFDIETYSPGKEPDPEKDKIITIQFQKIDLRTGKPKGKLIILKEWESSEREIVTNFFNRFFREGLKEWHFVPVGFNLNFEWEFLMSKFNKYLGKKFTSRDFYYKRPYVDLKHIVVLLNKGNFKGAKLSRFTSKRYDGGIIREWYESGRYWLIEKYVKEEAEAFLDFLQRIMRNIHKISTKRTWIEANPVKLILKLFPKLFKGRKPCEIR